MAKVRIFAAEMELEVAGVDIKLSKAERLLVLCLYRFPSEGSQAFCNRLVGLLNFATRKWKSLILVGAYYVLSFEFAIEYLKTKKRWT